MSKIFKFELPDITCGRCIIPVTNLLIKQQDLHIESISTDIIKKNIYIAVLDNLTTEQIAEQLITLITDTGVNCNLVEIIDDSDANNIIVEEPSTTLSQQKKQKKKKRKFKYMHLFKGLLGLSFGIAMIALMVSGVGLPFAAMATLTACSAALTGFLGFDSYKDAFQQLFKSKNLTMDSLFAISTISVVISSIASLYVPWLPMMLDAGPLIFGLRNLGLMIEESLKKKLGKKLTFKQRTAKTVIKEVADGSENFIEQETKIESLLPNDVIKVQSGQVVPVDGMCISDFTEIYKTILTGSTQPEKVSLGEVILSGMKVPDYVPFIRIKVNKPVSQSYLSQLDYKMAKSNIKKAPIENTANKVLQYFIPGVILTAAIAGIVIGVLFNPALAIQCAASVLVSACPCTLGFITPMAVKVGMTKAFEHGVQFKNSKALQKANNIDTVVFDLNGTLTTGQPQVVQYHISTQNANLRDKFFSYLHALEQNAKHPIAKSIYQFAAKKTNTITTILNDQDESNHSGVSATIDGKRCAIGNKSYMAQLGIHVKGFEQKFTSLAGQHVVYLSCDQEILGYVVLDDPLRDDAKFAIHELQTMGKEIHICTGASRDVAKRYAAELNIPSKNLFTDCVATSNNQRTKSKTSYIQSLQNSGKQVCIVGDGGNDAPAIKASDFGIAMKSSISDEITEQEAKAVILNHSLRSVVSVFAIAKQTIKSINQNLMMSLAYNAATILIAGGALVAVGFALNPGIGVALMIFQMGLILANQYRIKKKALQHLDPQRLHTFNQENANQRSVSTHQTLQQQQISNKKIPIPYLSKKRQNPAKTLFNLFKPAQPKKTITYTEPQEPIVTMNPLHSLYKKG